MLAPGYEPTRETASEIFGHARDNLAPYLRVRRLVLGDLPKTTSGKIRRVELRARESDPADADQTAEGEWRDDQFPELKEGGARG